MTARAPDTWTWAELTDRLAVQCGGDADAREWMRQALVCKFNVQDPTELPRVRRVFALQRMLGVLLALEDDPRDFTFTRNARGAIAGVFAKYLDGCLLEGPPWRLDPSDTDRPDRGAWMASASFD